MARTAAFATSVPLLALLGGVVGSRVADALALTGADERYVAVVFGLAAPLWIARVARPGSRRAVRATFAALGLPWIAALVMPRSSPAVTWLTGGTLFLALEAVVWAGARARRLGRAWPSRIGLALLVVLPGAYFVAAGAVVLLNTQMVMAPVRLAHQRPTTDPGEELVVLRTRDGHRIGATYSPAPAGRAGVVLVHGVADGRTRFLPWARRLREAGMHVLRIDLRAHGTSDGSVCTYGQREVGEVLAAYDYLRGRGAGRIAVVGTSMGGGVVMAAAPDLERRGARALVALAPASSFGVLVRQRVALLGPLAGFVMRASAVLARAVGQTPMTAWRPSAGLDRSRLPVLILHGESDTTIPLALSERLAERVGPRVTFVPLPGVGHDEIPAAVAHDDARWATVQDFLDAHLDR